ncbi:hypothetical protein [Pseudovibrio ascidiaceicola]|uniref:hypothetical protein n=1 Tax=Pseudovibrio ascidiaceicola TaxID=285279 RepID=UPI000D68D3E9|nr:hypothetical protein [Pseudovibrio ascidiaceicola]
MSVREFILTLEIGQQREIHAVFNSVRCTGSNGPFAIHFGDDNNRITFERGLEMSFIDEQSKFTIENTGDRKLELVIVTGLGTRLKDDRSLYSVEQKVPVELDALVTVKPNETFPVEVQGTPEVLVKPVQKTGVLNKIDITQNNKNQQIAAANATRVSIRVQNIGPVAVQVQDGIWLEPFASFETEANNALVAKVVGNVDGKVSVWEVSR